MIFSKGLVPVRSLRPVPHVPGRMQELYMEMAEDLEAARSSLRAAEKQLSLGKIHVEQLQQKRAETEPLRAELGSAAIELEQLRTRQTQLKTHAAQMTDRAEHAELRCSENKEMLELCRAGEPRAVWDWYLVRL